MDELFDAVQKCGQEYEEVYRPDLERRRTVQKPAYESWSPKQEYIVLTSYQVRVRGKQMFHTFRLPHFVHHAQHPLTSSTARSWKFPVLG